MEKVALLLTVLLMTACSLLPVEPTLEPPTTAPDLTPAPASTPLPFALIDANPVFSGICFESVYDAAGRTFVLRNAEELNTLFNESDNSGYCRRPAQRGSFDFRDGQRAIIGMWGRGQGCEAHHQIDRVDIDDVARTFIIRARLVVTGDCPYELVRPLWLGVSGYNDYDIRLLVGN